MKISSMTKCGLFAALMAVCSWLSIPLGDTAVTMQTFALLMALGLLGGKWGCVSILIYLSLGAVGVPVFSGLQGGFGVLLGPTGGYLWGFLAGGILYSLLDKKLPVWTKMVLCQLIIYACGMLWYYFAYSKAGIWMLLLPYLLPDAVKLVFAIVLTRKLKPHLT